jgi:2-polyprenyl-3-methyl-5-hydroxy-6-metoxy-1,4-benzoquinol methylase
MKHQDKQVWLNAQTAEKGHWSILWQDKDSAERVALINNETIKGEFIFDELVDYFKVDPEKDWGTLSILDVGCGPLSLVARNTFGKKREGVDPLKYPRWVYEEYAKQDFKVYLEPFEEFSVKSKFDVVLFYNALQHFANLDDVAEKCKQVVSKKGIIYLCEYLEVPTNDAHIQFLTKEILDKLFEDKGFSVKSERIEVRLPGYVERPGGESIGLYVAKCSLN